MIVGIGSDLVAIARIERAYQHTGMRFVNKILAPAEQQQWQQRNLGRRGVLYLATRFAAKEAFAKALGWGIAKVGLHNVSITNEASGKPVLCWQHSRAEGLTFHVSLSDDKTYALAFVVIESDS